MKVQIFGSKESLKGFSPIKVNNGKSKCFEVIADENIYNELVNLAKNEKFKIVGVLKK